MTDDRRPGTSIPGRLSVSMSCRSIPGLVPFREGRLRTAQRTCAGERPFPCLRRRAFALSAPAYAARAPVSPDASCRRGTYFFTYGLPAASSRCLAIVRKRPLVSVRRSVPPCASAIRASPMALGCCVGCATKKVSKEVAGNAISRSRLLSDRKIAHSRVCSLYQKTDTSRGQLNERIFYKSCPQ